MTQKIRTTKNEFIKTEHTQSASERALSRPASDLRRNANCAAPECIIALFVSFVRGSMDECQCAWGRANFASTKGRRKHFIKDARRRISVIIGSVSIIRCIPRKIVMAKMIVMRWDVARLLVRGRDRGAREATSYGMAQGMFRNYRAQRATGGDRFLLRFQYSGQSIGWTTFNLFIKEQRQTESDNSSRDILSTGFF